MCSALLFQVEEPLAKAPGMPVHPGRAWKSLPGRIKAWRCMSGRKAVPIKYRTSEKAHPCSIREVSLPLLQVAGMEFHPSSYCFLPFRGSLSRLGAKSCRSQLLGFGKRGFLQALHRDKSIEGVWKVKSRTNAAVQLLGGMEGDQALCE